MCCAEGEALLAPLRPLPPTIVDLLLTRNNAIGREFKQNIICYNSALSFTSMNAYLYRRYANNEEYDAYAFRIHGSVHHLMSPELIPNPGYIIQQPRFAQIYIFDSANELQNRLNVTGSSDVLPQTMQSLQDMMHDVNPFVNLFKTMEELSSKQPNGIEDIRMIFRSESDTDVRRYSAPTVDEIGVLIIGGEDESSIAPCNRDIVLRLRGNEEGDGPQCINVLHQYYDPLHYVLMFPTSESGWYIYIKSDNLERMKVDEPVEGQVNRNRAIVSTVHYYSSRLMIRAYPNNQLKERCILLESFFTSLSPKSLKRY